MIKLIKLIIVCKKYVEILKKTKRSEKIVDIKPNIYHIETDIAAFYDDTKNEYGRLEIDTSFYKPVIYCQLTAGSVVNLKDKQFRHNFKFYDKVMLEYGLIER